ncbi:MAG TPA: histidine kinase dimerization/phospho-acceptor domain-containing protein [Longimicrobiaceae bacterium]|nr:histidine kinase dimerization/phospho-acceptor domain-containing protein [Longimicrobiaceae bacterium]
MITENGADLNLLRTNKLDLLEQLADDLAHEIKNPLHSMVINLEVLKRRIDRSDAADSADLMRYVSVLGGELERVNRRIELLLRLIRPSRGSEDIPLRQVVEETLDLVLFEGERQNVSIKFEPGPLAPDVLVPREPIRQIVLNCLLDCIEMQRSGGSLEITVDYDGEEVSLTVSGEIDPDSPARAKHSVDNGRPRLVLARALADSFGATLDIGGTVAPTEYRSSEPGLRLTLTIPV